MDAIDVKLLKLLQANSRMTVSELSKAIDLPAPKVCSRLKVLDVFPYSDSHVELSSSLVFYNFL